MNSNPYDGLGFVRHLANRLTAKAVLSPTRVGCALRPRSVTSTDFNAKPLWSAVVAAQESGIPKKIASHTTSVCVMKDVDFTAGVVITNNVTLAPDQFVIKNVKGNGECLFTSAGRSLGVSGRKLRKQVAAAFKSASKDATFEPMRGLSLEKVVKFEKDMTVTAYADSMSDERAWGGEPELQAIAMLHRVTVVAYVKKPSSLSCQTASFQRIAYGDFTDNVVRVLYNGKTHYDAFYLVDEAEVQAERSDLVRAFTRAHLERFGNNLWVQNTFF